VVKVFKKNFSTLSVFISFLFILNHTVNVFALDTVATAKALRLANTITGGYMPASDPLFAQMVTKIQAGDMMGAADIAAGSNYFASYLARRLALQMQTPALDASNGKDNDATAFVIAHFVGTANTKPSISTLWSENATYTVNVGGKATHAAALTRAQLAAVDWKVDLIRVNGQTAKDVNNNVVTIPAKHVGGYTTLSDRIDDNSFAMYGAEAGTNLRMIAGIWQISTGLGILDFSSSAAPNTVTPRFIPRNDPNFLKGQGQPACIACHGGGLASIQHGYSTVADVFDFDAQKGFLYIANPTQATRKSLGSDPKIRAAVEACSDPNKIPCNPESTGVDPNQAWDLGAVWSSTGMLTKLGWTGATSGVGLNEFGAALGTAKIVYENLTKRVIYEICPMGAFTQSDITKIARATNPKTGGTDDLRTIVAMVASHLSCK